MLLRRGIEDATGRLRPSCGAARGVARAVRNGGRRSYRTAASLGRSTMLAGSSSMNALTTAGSNCLPSSERISETVASRVHADLYGRG